MRITNAGSQIPKTEPKTTFRQMEVVFKGVLPDPLGKHLR